MTVNERNVRLLNILRRLPLEDGRYLCKVIYSDPLKDVSGLLLTLYASLIGLLLLYPFDFHALVKNDIHWIENSRGIELRGISQAMSHSPPVELFDLLTNGTGLTLELWIETKSWAQTGPARILTYSLNTNKRNFTVAQSWDQLIVRLRTTATSLNGTNPHLVVDGIFNTAKLQQVVVTYDFYELRAYINGELRARSDNIREGFANWDPSYRLAIGNEITINRPWQGRIYYAAIFNRPLSASEVHRRYITESRLIPAEPGPRQPDMEAAAPVAQYQFDEGQGNVIHDSGSNPNPVDLQIPDYIRRGSNSFLEFSRDYFSNGSWLSDVIINILVFIPLGVLIHATLRARGGTMWSISIKAFFAGALFTLTAESIQFFSLTRNSSLIDVGTNLSGAALGIAIDLVYNHYLIRRADRLEMQITNGGGSEIFDESLGQK